MGSGVRRGHVRGGRSRVDLIGVEAWQQGQIEGLRRQGRHLPGMQEPRRECVGRSGFLSAE